MKLASILMKESDWKSRLTAVSSINFKKDSSPWYGKVTRKGKRGYNITNNNDTRHYFMKRLEKEFAKQLAAVISR